MVSKGMALECSLIYFIPIRLPADILLAKDKIPSNNGGLPKAHSCHSQPFKLYASTNALQTIEESERLFFRGS